MMTIYAVAAVLLAISWALSLVAAFLLGQISIVRATARQRESLFSFIAGFVEKLRGEKHERISDGQADRGGIIRDSH